MRVDQGSFAPPLTPPFAAKQTVADQGQVVRCAVAGEQREEDERTEARRWGALVARGEKQLGWGRRRERRDATGPP